MKVPISTSKINLVPTETTTGAEIIANSTPLVKTLADRIISFYNAPEPCRLNPKEQAIQNLFNQWTSNAGNEQLAKLTGVLTGFTPKLKDTAGMLKIGQLFKQNNEIYVVVFLNGGTVYGINRLANKNSSITGGLNIALSPYLVDLAEAGSFVKDLLTVKGEDLLSYLHNYISSASVYPLIKDLNTHVV